MSLSTVEPIEAEYDRHLRDAGFAAVREQMLTMLDAAGMTFYGRPVCKVLRPLFIDSATYARIKQASTRIIGAINRIGEVLLGDADARRELCLTPREEALLRVDPGGPSETEGRLDGFVDGTGDIHFVEYNPGVPGGMFFADRLCEIFDALKPLRAVRGRHDLRSVVLCSLIVPALRAAYERLGGRGVPRIGVVPAATPDGAATTESMTELRALSAMISAAGGDVRVTPLESLEYLGDALVSGDFRLEAAVVLDWFDAVQTVDPRHALWRAVRDHRVWLVNTPAGFIRGHKSLFALLRDPAFAPLFDHETNLAIARHVPWTRRVADVSAEIDGKRVELLSLIRARREHLVLKPISSYGGSGVRLGWECDDAAWAAALARALEEPYVVQERVEIPQREFPCLVDGEVRFERRYWDCNPYVWNGRDVEGVLVRLSASPLLNLTAGTGSMTAPYIVS